jgi:hypothetical protein
MTVTGPDGGHTYCRFALQHLLQPDAGDHPFYKLDTQAGTGSASPRGMRSCLLALNDLLHSHYAGLSAKLFHKRVSTLSTMFLCSVVDHDNVCARTKGKAPPVYNIDPILDMSIAGLSAPKS